VPTFTVEVCRDESHEREALRYVADQAPEVGEMITAEGVSVVVENVLVSLDPDSDTAMIEARRSVPAE
jgi:hypothetical protein